MICSVLGVSGIWMLLVHITHWEEAVPALSLLELVLTLHCLPGSVVLNSSTVLYRNCEMFRTTWSGRQTLQYVETMQCLLRDSVPPGLMFFIRDWQIQKCLSKNVKQCQIKCLFFFCLVISTCIGICIYWPHNTLTFRNKHSCTHSDNCGRMKKKSMYVCVHTLQCEVLKSAIHYTISVYTLYTISF